VCHTPHLLAICFTPSLADSITFLTLTRLVVVFIFVNFSFALFTPPLGDFHTLHLPIRHGVSYDGLVHTDVVVVAEVQELFSGELCAIVGDDGVRDPKSMDDVGEERHRLLGPDAG
jgi:hypothetical protein